jgi:glucose/mannose-6-phosphate isomerase
MLDSLDDIRKIDTRNMLQMVADMPGHIRDSNLIGRSAQIEHDDIKNVAICGLGGSAIGGDMISTWLSESCSVPCGVTRSYSVPAHVGPGSLVIAVSYSGDTEETLSMVDSAFARGAEVVAVSSGGRLKAVAEERGAVHCEVPSGLVPRATVGHVFGAIVGLLESAGITEATEDLAETAAVLRMVISDCGEAAGTSENPAKKLAHELHGTIPVSIGYGLSVPVARRWANQFNENAKMVAFSGELPEMNHNAIVGWVGDGRSQGYSMIFLDHDMCDAMMTRRVAATKEMLRDRVRVYSSTAMGRSLLAKMFSLVVVGDFTSIYAALLRGEDPSTTEPIDALKRILAEKGR